MWWLPVDRAGLESAAHLYPCFIRLPIQENVMVEAMLAVDSGQSFSAFGASSASSWSMMLALYQA